MCLWRRENPSFVRPVSGQRERAGRLVIITFTDITPDYLSRSHRTPTSQYWLPSQQTHKIISIPQTRQHGKATLQFFSVIRLMLNSWDLLQYYVLKYQA